MTYHLPPKTILFSLLIIPTVLSSTCVFTPTTCSCRYQHSKTANCLKPVSSKTNVCVKTKCPSSWKCDCQDPTHMCFHTTCVQYTASSAAVQPVPKLAAGEVVCNSEREMKCEQQTGAPLAPMLEVTPSPALEATKVQIKPSPSTKPTNPLEVAVTCTSDKACPAFRSPDWTEYNCILGTCRRLGTCDSEMDTYCSSYDTKKREMKCCDSSSGCALYHVQGDTSFCSTNCESSCMSKGARGCMFRKGGASVSVDTEIGIQSWREKECPVVS